MRYSIRFLLLLIIFVSIFLGYVKVQFEKLEFINEVNRSLHYASNLTSSKSEKFSGSCNVFFYIDESLPSDWVAVLYRKLNNKSVENCAAVHDYRHDFHSIDVFKVLKHNSYLQHIRLHSSDIYLEDVQEIVKIPCLKSISIDACDFYETNRTEVLELFMKHGLEVFD